MAGCPLLSALREGGSVTKDRRPSKQPAATNPEAQATDAVEAVVAPAAIERALAIYLQMQARDRS
jgi:hypothetical protein